jgi:hypothetical protein
MSLLEDAYMRLINDQAAVVKELVAEVAELEKELRKRPVTVGDDGSDWIIYSTEDSQRDVVNTQPKMFYCKGDIDADDILQDFVKTARIEIPKDYSNSREVVSPAWVAKARISKPIRKIELAREVLERSEKEQKKRPSA